LLALFIPAYPPAFLGSLFLLRCVAISASKTFMAFEIWQLDLELNL
jgi:hypothetical protein